MVTVISDFSWIGLSWNADNFHRHLRSNKHTGPWVSLPVCLLDDLDLRFVSYTRPKWLSVPHWERVLRKAGHLGVRGWWSGWFYRNVYTVAVCLK